MTTCRTSLDCNAGATGTTALLLALLIGGLCLLPAGPARGAMGGPAAESQPAGDPDYASGRAAFEREDWAAVVDHMTKVVLRRPWHDDAHNALGFAYRQQGDYGRALSAYHRALQLNPHHRQALEYLGEAYLDLDQPERARDVLARLRVACLRLAAAPVEHGVDPECEEWLELSAAIQDYGDAVTQ